MPMTAKRREKLVELGRHTVAILGGGVMLSFANLIQLVGLIRGEIFLALALLFGILIGMMTTELPHAVISGFLAFFAGILMFFGFIVLPMCGAVSLEMAETLVGFAAFSVVRVLLFSFLAVVLVGPVIGRIVGPQWHAAEIGKHELKVPLPAKEET
jgi:hypothetical protein